MSSSFARTVVAFMDILDIDENAIDEKVNRIISRTTFTKEQLNRVYLLLQYKLLINSYDESDCDNSSEFQFSLRLLLIEDESLKQSVCDIVHTVLLLNKTSLETNAQYILQQIFLDVDLKSLSKINEIDKQKLLWKLKVIDSILESAILSNIKIFLLFNDVPFENLLYYDDVEIKNHFITKTVSYFIQAVEGMNILDRIWSSVSSVDITHQKKTLVALCSLSEYYLPVLDENGSFKYKSTIVRKRNFWMKILQGLKSEDDFNRRCASYLAKRAVDYVSCVGRDIEIKTETNEPLFTWKAEHRDELTVAWRSFFILMETLEEKQGNIVLAGLALFNEVLLIDKCWRDCAFHLALHHPNLQITLRSFEYKVKDGLCNVNDAVQLLQAVNNINIFDESGELSHIKMLLELIFSHPQQLNIVLKAFPVIKWLPVPLFHLSELFATAKLNSSMNEKDTWNIIMQLSNIPCNNIIIAEAVQCNIITFVIENRSVDIKLFLDFIFKTQREYSDGKKLTKLIEWVDESLNDSEYFNEELWNYLMTEVFAVDFVLCYMNLKPSIATKFFESIENHVKKIVALNDRPYANKLSFENEFVYLCVLVQKITSGYNIPVKSQIINLIEDHAESLLLYLSFLITELNDVDQIVKYYKYFPAIFELLHSEKLTTRLHENSTLKTYDKYLMEITNVMSSLDSSPIISFKIEIFSTILCLLNATESKQDSKQNQGKLGIMRNKIYVVCSEIVFDILVNLSTEAIPIKTLSQLLHHMLDTGNEECFLWSLRIYKVILPEICKNYHNELHPEIFLKRSWQGVQDIRSNALSKPCMKEFINILLSESLILNETYCNLIKSYSVKILQYSALTNVSLYYLTHKMFCMGNLCEYKFMIDIVSDLLLFGRNTSKDQRITDLTVTYIKGNKEKFFTADASKCDHYLDSDIRNLATKIVLQSSSPEVVTAIADNISDAVLAAFRNKTRYHGNSQVHRMLFRALQHMLLFSVLCPNNSSLDAIIGKYVVLMEKLPHQHSIKLCFEILVAYNILSKGSNIDQNVIDNLRQVPLTSVLTIVYFTLKHKLKHSKSPSLCSEYNFVMDFLLSHTMGQLFNVRLYAQYFALKLHEMSASYSELSGTYEAVVKIIKHTFTESATEKNLIKLENCYFVNNFDVVENLTPKCIYNTIPCLTELDSEEIIKEEEIISIQDCNIYMNSQPTGKNMWENGTVEDPKLKETHLKNKDCIKKKDEILDVSIIQKKYIPWSHMFHGEEACVVNIKKNVKESGLVLVASLIDKLPNLGGLARTSEVFGVKQYVIGNMKQLEDKNFQGLSVSAEKWIDIDQVRPGSELKYYLQRMKKEGYTIVAAEQTSNSVPLQSFHFPTNTVLLLGHEKEGVSCDLLPYMDHCVEIPQRGCVRSLNVHVTAAIFVWEYVRQNLL